MRRSSPSWGQRKSATRSERSVFQPASTRAPCAHFDADPPRTVGDDPCAGSVIGSVQAPASERPRPALDRRCTGASERHRSASRSSGPCPRCVRIPRLGRPQKTRAGPLSDRSAGRSRCAASPRGGVTPRSKASGASSHRLRSPHPPRARRARGRRHGADGHWAAIAGRGGSVAR